MSGPQGSEEVHGTAAERGGWLALAGVSLLAFIHYLDLTMVATILPGIQRDLGASVGQLQWMIAAYVMVLGMLTVAGGRFGDLYGHGRLLVLGAGVFLAATILAGLAQSPGQLIGCRFLQGLGGAVVHPASAALIPHIVPERHRGLALGLYTSIAGSGLAFGPVLGGALLTWLSWRWAFYIGVPVTVIGLLLCWRAIAKAPRDQGAGGSIDWLGLGLLVIALGSLQTALMEGEHWGWTSPATLGLFAVALAAGAAFVPVERRAAVPIIDFSLFRHRLFVISAIAVVGIGGFIGLGNFLPPLYLQNVLNKPPYLVGFMLLAIPLLVVVLPPLAGRLVDRVGHLPLIFAGLASLILAALVQANLTTASPVWVILIGLALFGAGWGILQSTTAVTAIAALPAASGGLALGCIWTIWDISAAICLAIGGGILEAIDKKELLASIEPFDLVIEPFQHQVIGSLLSDPAEAQKILGQLSPGLEARIFPLFQESFTAGYNGAMWFLAAMAALCLVAIAVVALWRRAEA